MRFIIECNGPLNQINPKRRAANIVRKDEKVSARCVIGIGYGRTGQRFKQIAPPNRRVITMQIINQELSACRFIESDESLTNSSEHHRTK